MATQTQLAPKELNPPPPQPEEEELLVMGFFDHLDELRRRITRSVLAIAVGMLISVFFTNDVIKYLMVNYDKKLALIDPTDSVVVFFRVALTMGAMLAIPVVTYHVMMFVMPGLTRKERRWVLITLPATTLLFVIGLAFTWFYLIPVYIAFLSNFQSDIFQTIWTADRYITFVTAVLFWHAVAFETPVVFYALARMGLVNSIGMIKMWRQAIVGTAMVAAVITPTVDPVTMLVITVVLLGLYVISIALVFIANRMNRRRLAASPA